MAASTLCNRHFQIGSKSKPSSSTQPKPNQTLASSFLNNFFFSLFARQLCSKRVKRKYVDETRSPVSMMESPVAASRAIRAMKPIPLIPMATPSRPISILTKPPVKKQTNKLISRSQSTQHNTYLYQAPNQQSSLK